MRVHRSPRPARAQGSRPARDDHHGYEAQLAAGCKRVPRCTYDRGAFGRQVDKNEYISEDLNHFSVKGAAAAAAVAWEAMKQLRVIPQ